MSEGITRRQALRGAGAAGLGLGAFGGIDGLLSAAAEAAGPGRHGSMAADGAAGPETMGYYTRGDVPFYHALADAFTICDHYHCSVIGPTDPNRLMSLSATIDPAGTHGGPLLQTNVTGRTGGFSWRTMPEQLSAKGISWKVYTAGGGGFLDNVLTYFNAYRPGSALAARGLTPTFEHDFPADLHAGKLPQVSWVL